MPDETALTVFPVPIRKNTIAQVHIPSDLTKEEAEKICRVVMAFAVDKQN